VGVSAGAGGFEITIDGTPSADGTLDWPLEQGRAHLTGQMTANGAPLDGYLVVFGGGEEATGAEVHGGLFDIYLPAGDLVVFPEIESPPIGLIWPAPYIVSVPAQGEVLSLTHNFVFTAVAAGNPGRTVQGRITSNGVAFQTGLDILDADGTPIAFIETDPTGAWQVTLAPGTYQVRVPDEDLPDGFAGTTTVTFVVTADGVSSALLWNGGIPLAINTAGISISGIVTDPYGEPAAGVQILFEPGAGPSPPILATTGADGRYQVFVLSGTYRASAITSTLPAGVVIPIEVDVEAIDAPAIFDIALQAAAGTIRGTVRLDGQPAPAIVIAVIEEPDGMIAPVAELETLADGTYEMPLPAGTFTIVGEEIDGPSATILRADPRPVTIASGDAFDGIDFGLYTLGPAHPGQILQGRILRSDADLFGEVAVYKQIGGSMILLTVIETALGGDGHRYAVALSPGTYDVKPYSAQDVRVEVFDPIRIIVASDGITRDGQPLAGNLLDFQLQGEPVGIVLFDGAPVPSATIVAFPSDGGPPSMATADSNGAFAFERLPAGEYWVFVAPGSIPPGGAFARLQPVHIAAGGAAPSRIFFGIPPAAGNLFGQVTVDGTAAPARIHIFDHALRPVAITETGAGGNYSIPLPAGTYAGVAELLSPDGSEVPDASLVPIAFASTTRKDFIFHADYPSGYPNQLLSGTVSFAGAPAYLPVIAFQDGSPPLPVAMARPGGPYPQADYSMRLPYGDFFVALLPVSLPAGELGPAAVPISVGESGIASPNTDDHPVASGVLAIDPYGGNAQGQVRLAVSTCLKAILDRDTAALDDALDETARWGGLDKTGILAQWPLALSWAVESPRFDHLVSSVTQVNADEWTVSIDQGRASFVFEDGTGREVSWDSSYTNSPEWRLTVRRAGQGSPWLVAGNGLAFEEILVEHLVSLQRGPGGDTASEQVEMAVDEWPGVSLAGVSVSGAGIADGTLSYDAEDLCWAGFLRPAGSSPPPFAADFAALVPGNSYTFSVTGAGGPAGEFPILYHPPIAGLYPVARLIPMPSGGGLLLWNDVHPKLARPIGWIEIDAERLTQQGGEEVFELDGIPPGQNWLPLPAALFQDGATYRFSVQYCDAGGATQGFVLLATWPPVGP